MSDTPIMNRAVEELAKEGELSIGLFPLIAKGRRMERDRAFLLEQLQHIADAKPHEWGEDGREQFQEWAQNRARHLVRWVKEKEKTT